MWEMVVGALGSILGRLLASALWRWGVDRFGRPPVWTRVDVNPHYAPMSGVLATTASYDENKGINRDDLAYLSGMPITISIGNTGVGAEARTAHVREITMTVEDYTPLTEYAAEHGTLVALRTVQADGRGSEYDFYVRLSVNERTSLPLLSYALRENLEAPTLLTVPPDEFIEVTLYVTARHAGWYLISVNLEIQWGSRHASIRVREPIRILEASNVAWVSRVLSEYVPTGEVHDEPVRAAHEMWDEWSHLKEPLALADIEGRNARVHGEGGDLL